MCDLLIIPYLPVLMTLCLSRQQWWLINHKYIRHSFVGGGPSSSTIDIQPNHPNITGTNAHSRKVLLRRRDASSLTSLRTRRNYHNYTRIIVIDDDSTIFQPFYDMLKSANVTRYNSNSLYPRVDRVALVKTHKTASSTIASVLFRYSARLNLTIFRKPGKRGNNRWSHQRLWFNVNFGHSVTVINYFTCHNNVAMYFITYIHQ